MPLFNTKQLPTAPSASSSSPFGVPVAAAPFGARTSSFTTSFANKPSSQQGNAAGPTPLTQRSSFGGGMNSGTQRHKRSRSDEDEQAPGEEQDYDGEPEEEEDEWEDIEDEDEEDEGEDDENEDEEEEDDAEEGSAPKSQGEDCSLTSDGEDEDFEDEVEEGDEELDEEEDEEEDEHESDGDVEVHEEVLIIEEPETESEASPQFGAVASAEHPSRLAQPLDQGDEEDEEVSPMAETAWKAPGAGGSFSFKQAGPSSSISTNPFGGAATPKPGSNPFGNVLKSGQTTGTLNPFGAKVSDQPAGSASPFGKAAGSSPSLSKPGSNNLQSNKALNASGGDTTNGGFLKPLPLPKKSPKQSPRGAPPLPSYDAAVRAGAKGSGRGNGASPGSVQQEMDHYLSQRQPPRLEGDIGSGQTVEPVKLDTRSVLLNIPALPTPPLGPLKENSNVKVSEEPMTDEEFLKWVQPTGFRDYDADFPYNADLTLQNQLGGISVEGLLQRRIPTGRYDSQLKEMLRKRE